MLDGMTEPREAVIDVDRIARDPGYRQDQARLLLERVGGSIDHVELRRAAKRLFPELRRPPVERQLSQLVGTASTLQHAVVAEGAREDGRDTMPLEPTPPRPPQLRLNYPEDYGSLDEGTRNVLIRFCSEQLEADRDGRDTLALLEERYGWPYTPRTFYVGPWKAARLRRRKRQKRLAQSHGTADSAASAVAGAGHEVLTLTETDGPESFPLPTEQGGMRLTTARADYRARQVSSGEWEISVNARLDRDRMLKLHAQALELFFPPEDRRAARDAVSP